MTKQEQIEEIAKDIHRVCTACSGETFDEYTCDKCQAKLLIKKGYRKLSEDSVVLSREEWECLHNDYAKALYNARQNERKETAEKIFSELLKEFDKRKSCGNVDVVVYELAKSLGVEIKEYEK